MKILFSFRIKMIPLEYLIIMTIFNAASSAPLSSGESSAEGNRRIAKQCFSKHDLTKEVIEDFQQNPDDPPKRMLCYMKCFLEHKGLLDEDGNLNMDYVSGENYSEDIQRISKENDSLEADIGSDDSDAAGESAEDDLECLKQLGPIRSCSDMKGVLKCIPSIRQK